MATISIDSEFIAKKTNLKVIGSKKVIEHLGSVDANLNNSITFAESPEYLNNAVSNKNVVAIFTTDKLANLNPLKTMIICDNPRYSFFSFHNYLATDTDFYGLLEKSYISPLAKIHPSAVIAEKGVYIDDYVMIGAHVTVLERTHIEKEAVIQPSSVIGSEGFEYKRIGNQILHVIHTGGVYLEQGVEIGANSCVDKNVFGGYTRLGRDTKLDNLVHIAHGVTVGERCLLAASAMLAGSVRVDDDVFIGPSAVIRDGVHIGKGALVSLGAVVTQDVPPGVKISGNFAIEHGRFINFIKNIPE